MKYLKSQKGIIGSSLSSTTPATTDPAMSAAQSSTESFAILNRKHQDLCATVHSYKTAINAYKSNVQSLESLLDTYEATIPALPKSVTDVSTAAVYPLKMHITMFESILLQLDDAIKTNENTIRTVQADVNSQAQVDEAVQIQLSEGLAVQVNALDFGVLKAAMAAMESEIDRLQEKAKALLQVMRMVSEAHKKACAAKK